MELRFAELYHLAANTNLSLISQLVPCSQILSSMYCRNTAQYDFLLLQILKLRGLSVIPVKILEYFAAHSLGTTDLTYSEFPSLTKTCSVACLSRVDLVYIAGVR
jgi:hypothetical protein